MRACSYDDDAEDNCLIDDHSRRFAIWATYTNAVIRAPMGGPLDGVTRRGEGKVFESTSEGCSSLAGGFAGFSEGARDETRAACEATQVTYKHGREQGNALLVRADRSRDTPGPTHASPH